MLLFHAGNENYEGFPASMLRFWLVEIPLIGDFDVGFREEVLVELGAVVVGHGCHVVDDDLVGLGFDVGSVGGVVVVGNEIDVVGEDGR